MIGQYSLYEWLIFFYIYSFFGWIFESVYVSLRKKRWVNRGFLLGPFLPIYGGGAVMMLFVSEPFKSNLILTYFAGAVGATLLELVTGMVMESIFKVRYWDYSDRKYNYKGYKKIYIMSLKGKEGFYEKLGFSKDICTGLTIESEDD